jgi:cell division protein FtsN
MARGRQNGGTLLGVFIGLLIGVLMSFGVVWYMNRMPLPFRDKGIRDERPIEPTANGAPAPLPGKPGDKPRFEFYKLLPGDAGSTSAAAKPDANAPAAAAKPDATKAPAETETQYLQAGSFQNAAEADNLKAKLALMGVDANVQEVDVADKGTMHRVRVGPFQNTDEMNRVRGLLSQNGVQTAPVKGKNN